MHGVRIIAKSIIHQFDLGCYGLQLLWTFGSVFPRMHCRTIYDDTLVRNRECSILKKPPRGFTATQVLIKPADHVAIAAL
jgi:hypothetical protein